MLLHPSLLSRARSIMAAFLDFVASLPAALSELDKSSVVHVTVGNEACDLDSMVCALAHAHYLACQKGVVSIPLFQCPRSELPLRPEVKWLFQELLIASANLVFSGDLKQERLAEVDQLSITLVDHHVPSGLAAEFGSAVVEAIDHHKLQEGAGSWPIVLEVVGSCSTLVAERLLDDPSYTMEAPVATLLLAAIVLDTVDLRPIEGKVTPKDAAVAERLAPLASIAQEELYQQLSSAHFDIRGFSSAQLLQRDYKQVSVGRHCLGFSSIMALLSDFLQRDGMSEDLAQFSIVRDLHALVLVGISLPEGGEKRRQIALYQNTQAEVPTDFVDSLATILEASGELQCERVSGLDFEGPLLEQGNTALSRKQILPIITEFLGSLEQESPLESFVNVSLSPEPQPPEASPSPPQDLQTIESPPSPPPEQQAPEDTLTPPPATGSPAQAPHLVESSPGPSPGRRAAESVSQGGSLDSFVLVQGSEQSPSDAEAAQHGEEGQEPSLDHPNFAVIETTAPPEWEEPEGEESEGEEEEALTPTIPPEHPNFRAAEPSSTAAVLNVSSQSFPLEPTVTVVTTPLATDHREEKTTIRYEGRHSAPSPTIPEYSSREEAQENRTYRHVQVGGEELTVNMTLIQPYRKIIQHAGYIGKEQCAVVVISACYLPPRSLPNYQALINQLFFYVLSVLDHLVVDDYVIVYLHSGAPQNSMPSIALFHRFYQMVDRRLRKQLQHLYLVHPTFWVRTMLQLIRPFISRKFYHKVRSIRSLQDLTTHISIDDDLIPTPVLRADTALTARHPERRYQPKQKSEEGAGPQQQDKVGVEPQAQ